MVAIYSCINRNNCNKTISNEHYQQQQSKQKQQQWQQQQQILFNLERSSGNFLFSK